MPPTSLSVIFEIYCQKASMLTISFQLFYMEFDGSQIGGDVFVDSLF